MCVTESRTCRKGIKNKTNAINFLKNYLWSSLSEYLNINSMPFVKRDVLDALYKNPHEWKTALKEWLPEYQTFFLF